MVSKRFSSTAVSLAVPLACVAAIGGIVTAHAQEVENTGGLEEVIVTAQRRAESINDVGLSIQAFGAAALEALRVDDVKDLTTVVPSFTVSQSYQGVPTYTLRGIGFNTINLSATSTVGTYVDEVAYAYPIMNTGPLMDLERVEVLKGPQGTLYGRNTTAGLINFVTAKPTSEFQAGVTADVGNYETVNAGGYVSGPLSERVQMRIAVRGEQSGEGWQESNSRDETLGEIKRYGVRGSLAMQPTDSTHIDLSATWWKNEADTVAGQGIGFTPATASSPFNAPGLVSYIAANQPSDATDADWAPESRRASDIGTGLGLSGPLREDNPFTAVKLRLDQELTDSMKLVSLTSYNEFERNALSDWSGAPYEILLQNTVGKIESLAEDFHLEGETERMNWLVGAYYANDKILDSNRTLLGQNANVSLIRTVGQPLLATPFNCCGYTSAQLSQAFRTYVDEGHIETTTWSVFANADWRLTDALKLTTGVRYTEDKQEYRGCSRDFNGNMLPNVNVVNRALYFQAYGVFAAPITEGQCNTFDPVAGSFGEIVSTLDEDNVSWRVALDWAPVDGTLLYTSVSRGAKAGTTPINAANLARQNAPVRQELLTAYEIGTKSTLANQTVQANLSVFFYDYEDKQISTYFADPIYTALTRLDNLPESNAYGVDADLTWQPVDGFTIAGAVLWLQTEVEDYVGTNAAGQPQNYDGAEFIYSPEWQGSLSFIYDRPVTSGLALQMTLNGRYQTESNTIFEDIDLYKIPSYATVNASIGLRSVDDRWSFTLWSRNALDEYYWSAVASNANVVVRFPSPPRTYGATFGINF
ncbi:outer membrane receptor protein involved in Fe transport [Povalibacter uvarum]|uniref:Outer membrane receptor protein involved in Fe transport n=1 Tax=Povalibacter uvarum TaxID=732238 RepID=A0A841HIW9_9GAMM|nr:TonB-dependent receptor [Povalibacter uvarum]MBB6092250.1 outer membrane receptor protein involved in Fe transport [Povalibacter uvarum]